MGYEFSGTHGTGNMQTRLTLGYEHPTFLQWNSGNARLVLGMLGLSTEDGGFGSCTMPEARRAILQARARFPRIAPQHTRAAETRTRGKQARSVIVPLDEDGLARRLDAFEEFINTMDRMGADRIQWG